jgi:hypothetical protein
MIDTDKYEGHTEGEWDLHSMGDGWTIGQLKKIDRTLMQDAPLLLQEVKRLREKNRIQRKILDAYSQYRDARYEDCETWMLEKGFRVMVQYGDEEQSEWKVEVE